VTFLDAASRFWHPVARTQDVGLDSVVSVTLLGRELALWHRRDGTLGLVDDLCPHRGTRLSFGHVGADGCITCPYHAWEFAPDGRCTHIPQLPATPIPAKADVGAVAVTEHGALIWACLDPDAASPEPPSIPEADDDEWTLLAGEPMDWACQSTRQIENFLDIAHFSVLHVDAFGNPDVMAVPEHHIDIVDAELRTTFEYPAVDMLAEPDADGRRPVAPMRFDYTVRPPFWVRIDSETNGHPHILVVANQPVTETTCRIYWIAVMPAALALPAELVEAGEQIIFGADRRIVETQRPERLPLDLTAELHLPFDRLAVAYRRAMTALGFPGAEPSPVSLQAPIEELDRA
jgi:phenylpropionate dioxygenase-like ring-hydroxylating dioxygenase large terminal subunit